MVNAVLLFGGSSEERLVSVASAQNLCAQYQFSQLLFLNLKGELFEVSQTELLLHRDVFTKEFIPLRDPAAKSLEEFFPELKGKVVFLGLHGSQGENGDLQALLEQHRLHFTGSGSLASRIAFNKDQALKEISDTGILQPLQVHIKVRNIDKMEAELEGFLLKHKKMVLKPTASGSSFGLFIVQNVTELAKAMAEIKSGQFTEYIAENFIRGRELTVGVYQQADELMALPASEIVLNEGRAFDYEGKYLGSGSTEITPAELSNDELLAAQKLALDAHLAFGCYGYSRTDMILTSHGPYFLETNTLPGLSKPSFFPQQLQAADIPFLHFIQAQIALALRRYETH